MGEVRLSGQARVDLVEISDTGVEQFGVGPAERHLRAIRQSLELLATHPLAGQARPEFRQDVRAISIRPHRILYAVEKQVIRVIHQRRDVAAALRGER